MSHIIHPVGAFIHVNPQPFQYYRHKCESRVTHICVYDIFTTPNTVTGSLDILSSLAVLELVCCAVRGVSASKLA